MYPLIICMLQKEPEQRPTMEQAMSELEQVISKLPRRKLRARLRERKDDAVLNVLKDVYHIFRTSFYVLLRLPPIPTSPADGGQPDGKRRTFNFPKPFQGAMSRAHRHPPSSTS